MESKFKNRIIIKFILRMPNEKTTTPIRYNERNVIADFF